MPRDAEPSLSEKTFVAKALDEGLRLDNRKFEQFRPLELTFGDEFGVADVKCGKTRHVLPTPPKTRRRKKSPSLNTKRNKVTTATTNTDM